MTRREKIKSKFSKKLKLIFFKQEVPYRKNIDFPFKKGGAIYIYTLTSTGEKK